MFTSILDVGLVQTYSSKKSAVTAEVNCDAINILGDYITISGNSIYDNLVTDRVANHLDVIQILASVVYD